MRPIDADALKESLAGNKAIDYAIDNAPTLDVRPVVHGHWIEGWDTKCSVCGMSFSEMPFSYDAEGGPDWVSKYCPNCGNPMDEKEDRA